MMKHERHLSNVSHRKCKKILDGQSPKHPIVLRSARLSSRDSRFESCSVQKKAAEVYGVESAMALVKASSSKMRSRKRGSKCKPCLIWECKVRDQQQSLSSSVVECKLIYVHQSCSSALHVTSSSSSLTFQQHYYYDDDQEALQSFLMMRKGAFVGVLIQKTKDSLL